MEYRAEQRGEVLLIRIDERQATLRNGADGFRSDLEAFVRAGSRYIVLDFHAVQYADSTMLGAILSVYGLLGEDEGDLVVCGIEGAVAEAFGLAGIDRIVRRFPSVELAVSALA
jgi:anti-sigma B factor antagonist